MGIFNKLMNKWGAISGMLAGLTFTMGYIIYFKGVFIAPFAANIPENWILRISPEGAGVIGMAINFAVALAISKNTAPPPAHIQQLVEDIRVPRQDNIAPRIGITCRIRGTKRLITGLPQGRS